MTPLTHLTRNNSQVGLHACQANGETVVNVCMYINDICMVYDVTMMCNSSPALPIPSMCGHEPLGAFHARKTLRRARTWSSSMFIGNEQFVI